MSVLGERWCVVYRVSVERVWSSGWGRGETFKGLPHTPTSVNQTRTRPGMLYGHRNIAMLYGGPCLNLIYISALPHRGNWGGGGGGGRGEGPRRGKKNAIYSYSIGSPGPSSLRRSRYLISLSGPNARNIDARVPPPIFIILPRPIFLIDKFRRSIIRRLSF